MISITIRSWARAIGVVLALALTSFIGLVACSEDQFARGPQLTFQKQSHDMGQVSAKQKSEYQFIFRNTGTRELEISQVQIVPAEPGGSTAGVEAIPSSTTLNPGGSGAILVTLNQPTIGRHDLHLQVRSNDPASPEQTLTLQVEVVP